jgi:hypothetical protein
MNIGDHLIHTIVIMSALISLTGGCRERESAAVGMREAVETMNDEAQHRGRTSGAEPAAPYRAASSLNAVDSCAVPLALNDLNVCYTYASCCGFTTEVTPSACALSIANERAVCECSFGATNKVRCEQTVSGVSCRCR